jgi:hypothetical protein
MTTGPPVAGKFNEVSLGLEIQNKFIEIFNQNF